MTFKNAESAYKTTAAADSPREHQPLYTARAVSRLTQPSTRVFKIRIDRLWRRRPHNAQLNPQSFRREEPLMFNEQRAIEVSELIQVYAGLNG